MLRTSQMQNLVCAEDLVQETFQKAWQNFHSFRGNTTAQFAKWLLTIHRNNFLAHCRKHENENHGDWDTVLAFDDTPLGKLISIEQEAKLHACIAELDKKDQQILTMRHFEGLTYREIATQLNSQASTVCGIHKRALAALSKLMQAESYSHSIEQPTEEPDT